MKSRSWIKGHFFNGMNYGLLFGLGIGFFLALSNIRLLILVFIFGFSLLLFKDTMEEHEFKKWRNKE